MSVLHSEQAPGSSRRDRVRAATIAEIKQTAIQLMREHGPDIRFADIAREMGLSAPALYRYFADRDELLSALMADGFRAFAEDIAAALDTAPADDLGARVAAVARTYRRFATSDPQRFSLLFGLPAPGAKPHGTGPAGDANVSALTRFEELVRSVIDHGTLPPPLERRVGASLAKAVRQAQPPDGSPIPPDTYQALLHVLAALHGFACLEAFGHLDWISARARDELFDSYVSVLAQSMGAAPPP